MKVKDMYPQYPRIVKCLEHLGLDNDCGPLNMEWELPKKFGHRDTEYFLIEMEAWLIQFEDKKTNEVIGPKDFQFYLFMSQGEWDQYDDRDEWTDVYGPTPAIESFASSEARVMDTISAKYNGTLYNIWLNHCFQGSWSDIYVPYGEDPDVDDSDGFDPDILDPEAQMREDWLEWGDIQHDEEMIRRNT